MIKEAENIILNKEYFELTAEELDTVSELVQNAEEYDEMKWFLASTQQVLANEQIEATPELKSSVMDYLHKDDRNRKFWLNGVMVFLFPEDKRFYQKPAFQMSIAALLLIGFLMVYNRPMTDQQMALNDAPEQEFDKTTGELEKDAQLKEEDVRDEDALESELSETEGTVTTATDLPKRDLVEKPLLIESSAEEENAFSRQEVQYGSDGIYGVPFEDLDEYREGAGASQQNAKSSATNNELDTKTVIVSENKDANIDRDQKVQTQDQTVALDKERNKMVYGRTNNKGKLAKKESLSNEVSSGSDLSGLDDSSINSNQGSSGNVTNASTNSPGNVTEAVVDQVNVMSTSVGGTAKNDIQINQLRVSETKELKSLFTTFK